MIGHVFPPGIPVVSQGSFSWAWAGLLCSEVEAWGERQCSQWWRGARGREGSWLWWPGCLWCACVCSQLVCLWLPLWKGTFGQGLVETEESAELADAHFHLLLPSQSEVPREGIGRHQLMLGRGSTRLPRHPPRPQSHGRRAGRKGKHLTGFGRADSQGPPRCALHSRSCSQRGIESSALNIVFLPRLSIYWDGR